LLRCAALDGALGSVCKRAKRILQAKRRKNSQRAFAALAAVRFVKLLRATLALRKLSR
jgi:hypothetical protein